MTDTLNPDTVNYQQALTLQILAQINLANAQRDLAYADREKRQFDIRVAEEDVRKRAFDVRLAEFDAKKRDQDIQFAPWILIASGAGAAAALMAATATLIAILFKWAQH